MGSLSNNDGDGNEHGKKTIGVVQSTPFTADTAGTLSKCPH